MSRAEHDLRVDYVELPATDLGAMADFYGQAFGWKFTEFGPDYTSFADGRLQGGFRREETVTRGGPLIVIYAVDLEDADTKVRAAGGD